jgi:hypothetical protein
VAGLAQAKTDGSVGRVGGDVSKKLTQPLKRIGLQEREKWIHGPRLSGIAPPAVPSARLVIGAERNQCAISPIFFGLLRPWVGPFL